MREPVWGHFKVYEEPEKTLKENQDMKLKETIKGTLFVGVVFFGSLTCGIYLFFPDFDFNLIIQGLLAFFGVSLVLIWFFNKKKKTNIKRNQGG